MTPYKQLVKHNPENGQYGDCFRTAIGSMLDMPPERVPHFLEDGCNDGAVMLSRIREWLRPRGYDLFEVPFDAEPKDVLSTMQQRNPDIYYILGCASKTADHVVVACGDKVVSDPAGYEPDSLRRDSAGMCWVYLLVPNPRLAPPT